MKWIKKINETLLELMMGIFFCGVVFQVSLVWVTDHKIAYSLGLWLGIVAAWLMAFNMWRTLDKAIDLGEAGAMKMLRVYAIIRYLAAVVFLGGTMLMSGYINPLAAFLGLISLKVAAYIQPITHKVIKKIRR